MTDTWTVQDASTAGQDHCGARAILWVYPEERWSLLAEGTTLIGRSEHAGIRLSGGQVSRQHATITVGPTGIVLRDEGSLNKPRCNLAQSAELFISNNDVIRIGDWVGVVLEGIDAEVERDPFTELPGGVLVGPRSRGLWQRLTQVAENQLPIVIEGASGTGKEVIASAIHRLSARTGRFVAVNCAAQPEGLFESQFFGHTKGAFTGAAAASDGYFVAAEGGTLFLDELIELSPTQQAKVLRAVEESRVLPVGSTQPRPVNVRIVSAAQRSLASAADEGRFRADLHARLSGMTVRLLPLHSRREEIPRLFRAALAAHSVDVPRLTAGFVERLCHYPWTLNVRELVTVARRCAAIHTGVEELGSRHLAELLELGVSSPPTNNGARHSERPEARADSEAVSPASWRPLSGVAENDLCLSPRTIAWFNRNRAALDMLRQAMAASRGNLSQAARRAGISRQQAQRLLDAAAKLEPEAGGRARRG